MAPLLQVNGLYKEQRNFRLNDINLELEAGKIMGLIGVNGAGKTTLINTVARLYIKDGGKVYINSYSMDKKERRAKSQLGLVLDEDIFESGMTVRQNGLLYGGWYKKFDRTLFFQLCERFRIPVDKKLGQLSTGFQMRFQLAFALSHDAMLFLMDEPAAGLDTAFRKTLIGCMQDLVRGGERGVVFSTHITEDLEEAADYIVMLHKGEILFYMEKEKLMDYFVLLEGTKEQVKALDSPDVIVKEYNSDGNFVFARNTPSLQAGDMEQKTIHLDDIMYYLEGGMKYDPVSVIRSLD